MPSLCTTVKDQALHDFRDDVLEGLSSLPRRLPCRYFYDLEGSRLFDRICDLPEYYLTRCEEAILAESMKEIVDSIPRGALLAELGSGASRKTRRFIDALIARDGELTYIPVDVSAEFLEKTSRALESDYASLNCRPIAGDFTKGIARLHALADEPVTLLFLGSSLGNFEPREQAEFVRMVGEALRPGDTFLLGLDLVKERSVLEAAYNDRQGVTARFNLNLLARINRELDGTFDLRNWEHLALWNEKMRRIEMYLAALRPERFSVAGREFGVGTGDRILTEYSHKFTPSGIGELAASGGMRLVRSWVDPQGWFSLNLLTPRSDR